MNFENVCADRDLTALKHRKRVTSWNSAPCGRILSSCLKMTFCSNSIIWQKTKSLFTGRTGLPLYGCFLPPGVGQLNDSTDQQKRTKYVDTSSRLIVILIIITINQQKRCPWIFCQVDTSTTFLLLQQTNISQRKTFVNMIPQTQILHLSNVVVLIF